MIEVKRILQNKANQKINLSRKGGSSPSRALDFTHLWQQVFLLLQGRSFFSFLSFQWRKTKGLHQKAIHNKKPPSYRSLLSYKLLFLLASLSGIFLLSACGTPNQKPNVLIIKQEKKPDLNTQPKQPVQKPSSTSPITPVDPNEIFHPEGFASEKAEIRVALLLPLSSNNKIVHREAQALLQAAELAVFLEGSKQVLILIKDTEGNAELARKKAQEAIKEGAQLILGPVLSHSVEAVARTLNLQKTPMIALSSDPDKGSSNVFMLGFPVEEDIRNLIKHLAPSKLEKYAFLGPNSSYGRRARNALEDSLNRQTSYLSATAIYTRKTYPEIKRAIDTLPPSTSNQIQAILVPEYGFALRTALPTLVQKGFYRQIDLPVLFLGTSLWMDPTIAREPAIQNGLFAAPSQKAAEKFNQEYKRIYHTPPERLSSLAYDGVILASYLGRIPSHQWQETLTNPLGFYGSSGLFRFLPNGHIQRSLAIYTLSNGQIQQEAEALEQFTDTES